MTFALTVALCVCVEAPLDPAGLLDELTALVLAPEETAREPEVMVGLASARVRLGRQDLAIELAEAVKKVESDPIIGETLRTEALLGAAEALAEAGHAEQAMELARRCEPEFHRAHVKTQIVRALQRSGRFSDGVRLIPQIRHDIGECIAAVNLAMALRDRPEPAAVRATLQQVDRLLRHEPESAEEWTWRRRAWLVTSKGWLGQHDEARALIDQWQKLLQREPDVAERGEAISRLLWALAQLGDRDAALEGLAALEKDGASNDSARLRLVETFVEQGWLDDAERVAESMETIEAVQAWTTIGERHAESNARQRALAAFERADRVVRKQPPPRNPKWHDPIGPYRQMIVVGQFRSGFEDAWRPSFARIENEGFCNSTRGELALAMVEKGRLDEALDMARRITSEGFRQKAEALRAVAKALAAAGRADDVRAAVDAEPPSTFQTLWKANLLLGMVEGISTNESP